MKKILFLTLLTLFVTGAKAKEVCNVSDSLHTEKNTRITHLSTPLEPTCMENICEGSSWGSHWFVEAKGGSSTFIGSPIGKGTIIDHTMPVLQFGFGKWFTPNVGARLEIQGFQFKNANLDKMCYQFYHADYLCNITGRHGNGKYLFSRLDVIPFLGVGMIHNADWERICKCRGSASNSHPIAFCYGLQMQYPLNNRLHLLAEVSGLSTLKSFDNINLSEDFGDHMLNFSFGLSFSLGKTEWRKVLDARPYIQQNAFLMEELTSLRERMNNITSDATYSVENSNTNLVEDTHTDTLSLDVPVYFYFVRNTTNLVNQIQLSNLEEIANLVKGTGYRICITGAADNATGTISYNQELSEARARFIADQFIQCGIREDNIDITHLGGIDKYNPIEANRNTCVIIVRR